MKSIKIKSFIGAGPGDQEASYWTQEDWDRHAAYVDKVKADGTYGQPIERTFNFQSMPEFDEPIIKPIEYAILIPKGILKDGVDIPKFNIKYK